MEKLIHKTLFLIAIVSSIYSMAQDDTLGRYPYFYTYGLPENNCDTVGTICLIAGDNAGDGDFFNDFVRKVAFKMHTDDTIHIVGIAFSCCYEIMNHYRNFSIYDTLLEPIESVITLPNSGMCCYQPLLADEKCMICLGFGSTANSGLIFKCAFFPDSSVVDVVGDFYIGGYKYKTGGSTDDNSPIGTPMLYYFFENHNPPYHFPERHFKVFMSQDKDWNDYISLRSYPLIFPIIDIPCQAVDNVYLVDTLDTVSGVRTLSATWDSIRYQSLWVVTVEDESGALVLSDTVTTRYWTRHGFEHDVQYTVSVQSRCDSPRPTWSAQRKAGIVQQANVRAMPCISVHPNPTSNKAVLHFGEPIPYGSILEVCDQGGRRLSVHKPQAGSLSMELSTESLAAGTYLLRLTTPQWTAMGKLVVVH